MRLTDLDPRWLIKDGRRVGFIFRSPTRPSEWQSCFQRPTPSQETQAKLISDALVYAQEDEWDWPQNAQGCDPNAHWDVTPDLALADWNNISVVPSLDGSRGGNWHGFITNGAIVGGL